MNSASHLGWLSYLFKDPVLHVLLNVLFEWYQQCNIGTEGGALPWKYHGAAEYREVQWVP